MRKFSVLIYLLAALAAASCDSLQIQSPEGAPVYISACTEENIGDGTSVKSPFTATVPSESNPLGSLVLVSTDSYKYHNTAGTANEQDGSNGPVHIHTPATFTSGTNQLLGGVLYNSNAASQPMVYFSALSPKEGWNIIQANEKYSAQYTFNGTQDVMFAPQTQGNYNATSNPVLRFKHLLTLVKLSIYAENENVAMAWGKLQSIKIKNAHDMGNGTKTVNVNLSQDFVYGPDENSTAKFLPEDTKVVNDFFYRGTDNIFPGQTPYTLTYPSNTATGFKAPEVAYVMLAPVDALAEDKVTAGMLIPEFEIEIITDKRSVVLGVDLISSITDNGTNKLTEYYAGSTMGKQFALTLKFTMGNTVAVQAEVTKWETGGYGVGDVTE